MSDLEELREQRERLLALRRENKEQLDSITARINDLETVEDIVKKVAKFTPAEQDALFQELRAGGINSGEAFGTI